MQTRSGCRPFAFASCAVAIVCLVEYLVLDYFVVRIRPYPAEANNYDWTILFFPAIPALLLFVALRSRILRLDTGPAVASLLLGLVLSIPLIATVGIWFHFAIGGKL